MSHVTFAMHLFYINCCTLFVVGILCDCVEVLQAVIKAFQRHCLESVLLLLVSSSAEH